MEWRVMILIVTYDLHNPGRDYPKIEKVLKASDGGWAHPQGSVWLLDTVVAPGDWRDRLTAAADPNDEFLVAQLHQNWATRNTEKSVTDWLKSPARRW
jgi:hypothetical protein